MEKKILFITLRADWGGGPKHVDLLIKNLSEDFNIYVACPGDEPFYYEWKLNSKVKDIFILPHRKFSFHKLIRLYFYIKKSNINLIHSHGKGAGIYSRLLKLLNPKLKVIHTLHGFHIEGYNLFKKIIYIFIERVFSNFTDKFVNVSKGEKNICLHFNIFNNDKSVIIYNGIKQLSKINNAKQTIHLDDKFIITTISRFDYPKNMELAYRIAKIFKEDDNVLFLWIGDGKERRRLEDRAKREGLSNISFVGFTDKVSLYLSATDIYLSTSRWEGLPYALIEAQSLGIPIVATDVVGNNDVVVHRKNGFLYHKDYEAVKYIKTLLNDKNIYDSFSKNAKENFYENFNINSTIKDLEKIYKRLT